MTENRHQVGDRVTIYARGKKGIFVADFFHDGQHRRQSLRTADKRIADQRARGLSVRLDRGEFALAPEPVSFRDAVEMYMSHLETEGRARKTLVKYRGVFKIFGEFLETQSVSRIGQVTIAAYDRFRAMRAKIRDEKTVYTEGVILKQLFSWGKSRKLISESPLAAVKLKKPARKPMATPTHTEIDSILEAIDGRRRPIIAMIAFTGMRVGELQHLQPRDLDLAGNWIHIVSRPGLRTKSGISRKVPIHPRLRALVGALLPTDKPWLFTQMPSVHYPNGDHWLSEKKLNEDFQSLLMRIGLPAGRKEDGYTIHSLRHYFETHTVNSGIPQRVIDAWMGHSSDKSMAAVYYRLSDEESQSFMAKVPFDAIPKG